MKVRMRLVLCLVAGFATFSSPALTRAQGAAEPIDLSKLEAPGNLTGYIAVIRVPNVQGTLNQVQGIAQKGMPSMPLNLPAMFGANFGDPTLAGLPEGAGAAVIVPESPDPKAVLVMAVAPEQRTLYEQSFQSKGMATEVIGDLLVAGDSLEILQASHALIAGHEDMVMGGGKETGVAVDVNMQAVVRQFGPLIEQQINEIVSQMKSAAAMPAPTPAPEPTPGSMGTLAPAPTPSTAQMASFTKMAEGEFRAFYNIAKQVDTARIKVDLTDKGLRIDKALKAVPGSNMAALIAAPLPAPNQKLATYLPGGFAARLNLTSFNGAALVDFCIAELRSVLAQLAIPETDLQAYFSVMEQAKAVYGGAAAGNMIPAGGKMMDSVWAVETTDPEAVLKILDGMPALAKDPGIVKFYNDIGQTIDVTFQRNAREYNGVPIHKFTMTINYTTPLPPEAQQLQTMMGLQGPYVYDTAFVGNTLLQTTGTMRIEELIDAAKAGGSPQAKPLHAESVYGAANGYFDADLGAFVQIAMQGFAAAASQAPGQGAQMAGMMMMVSGLFAGVDPMVGVWKVDGDTAKGSVVIPSDLIVRALGFAGMATGASMGMGQPGMGQPGMGQPGMDPSMSQSGDMGAQPQMTPEAAPAQPGM